MMMVTRGVVAPVAAVLLLSACATIPTGPTVMVLPGNGKSFEQFQGDDVICRQWALQQTGTTTGQASSQSTVSGAAIGTLVGAAAGAALGAAAGSPATGAAAGAGIGLLGGTAVGAGRAEGANASVHPRYNAADAQDPPRACVEGAPCTPGRSGPDRCGLAPTRRAAVAGA